jgi:hypothetical protein
MDQVKATVNLVLAFVDIQDWIIAFIYIMKL